MNRMVFCNDSFFFLNGENCGYRAPNNINNGGSYQIQTQADNEWDVNRGTIFQRSFIIWWKKLNYYNVISFQQIFNEFKPGFTECGFKRMAGSASFQTSAWLFGRTFPHTWSGTWGTIEWPAISLANSV